MYTVELSKTKYTIHALVPGNKCHTNGGGEWRAAIGMEVGGPLI